MKEGHIEMSVLFGLLGEKLSHSISPAIHSLIFKELNIDGCYHLFEVEKENLRVAVGGLGALGAKGVNVTIPYKVPIMEYIDELSPEAQKIGSINTICFNGKKTIGYNTDYYGFGMALDKYEISITGKKAVILGYGGAAKGVAAYLIDNGVKDIIVASRDIEGLNNIGIVKDLNLIKYNEIINLNDCDIIINCTPCGMYPEISNSPLQREVIEKFSIAFDLIYNPKETLFLKHAKNAGLKAVNGLYMLVGQAVASEKLWNGVEISREIIDKIYEEIGSKFI